MPRGLCTTCCFRTSSVLHNQKQEAATPSEFWIDVESRTICDSVVVSWCVGGVEIKRAVVDICTVCFDRSYRESQYISKQASLLLLAEAFSLFIQSTQAGTYKTRKKS